MGRIFVTRRLAVSPASVLGSEHEIDVFEHDRPPSRQELLERGHGCAGLVTLLSDAIDEPLLEALPTVRVVANHAVGTDNVDVAACTRRGVWVTNTPGVLTEATADLTMALLLAVCRRVVEGDRLVRQGRFTHWSPTMLLGLELSGATLGVYGRGRIGEAVARRAEAFGMRVLHTSRGSGVPLPTLLAESDVISIHAPLTDATRHAFDEGALARMRTGAILINTARGPIVDEDALVSALDRGHLRGAGLDVYEDEPAVHPALLERDDVVLLPHVGSATDATRRRMGEMALRNAAAALRAERPPNAVNDVRV